MRILIQFEKKPVFFDKPEFIISSYRPALFMRCFEEMENALKKGYYLAGFFSYEAGCCFEEKLRNKKSYDFPLVFFGAFKGPSKRLEHVSQRKNLNYPKDLKLNITKENYSSNIERIRDYIAKGDVYQITYCIKLFFNFYGDPFSFYGRLLKGQPVPYPVFLDTGKFQILSLSPELFIKKRRDNLLTKPMKGTWPRSANILKDMVVPLRLKYDKKNRAENVMIADLLRNDLGRFGRRVKAPSLFEVARYKTLCQMTSTVSAKVEKDISIYRLFSSIFPSGSVTGAPKIRAMQVIGELEKEDRKIYTGAIGYISPEKEMFFNIPIRTILIQGNSAEMGIGGGIVWDSTAEGEWQEGLLKARFLTGLSSEKLKEI